MNKISIKRLIIVGIELLLALPLGLVFTHLGIGGVAWIFGGILSGALVLNCYRLRYKNSLKPNITARKIGQALVGLAIGFTIAHGNLENVANSLPIFIFLTFFILLTGSLNGYFYARITKVNILSAMLATVPGSVTLMSSLAADYQKNVSLVALVQLTRLTLVIFLIPLIARVIAGNGVTATTTTLIEDFVQTESPFIILYLVLILAFLVIRLAAFLRIPAAPFFGALIVGMSFNYLVNLLGITPGLEFRPPPLMSLGGNILLGITIGEYWGNKQTLEKKTMLAAIIPVMLTISSGFIAALIAVSLTSWDWLTCMLLTAPGGAPEMILVALALDHNVEIVTAGHLVRLMIINASLPLWVFLFRRFDNE